MDETASPTDLVAALQATVGRIAAACEGLSALQSQASPGPNEWSPVEVLWHIRATADVYGEHIARILDEDTPAWRHVSPRARMKKSRYDLAPFAQSFAAFSAQREELVSRLRDLPPGAWGRAALVRGDGREWRLTLHERVRGMVQHERVHCAQFETTTARVRATPAGS